MRARAIYIFVHFFAVYCKTTTSNDQIKGFVGNMNTQRLIILFCLFELKKLSLQIKLLENPVTLNKLNKLEQLQRSLKIERILGVVVMVALPLYC